ncbi:S41 family peptidase [Clostridiaceae bacterium HSG29]|nr:S41 family peptidase [Clostridiaceae bacterium HSG29]
MRNLKRITSLIVIMVVLSTSTFAAGFTIQPNPENEKDYFEYLLNFVMENFKNEILESGVTKDDLIEGAYKGIFDTLDEHSVYFNGDEYEDFTTSTEGEFGGIGISVTKEDKYIKVVSPIEGTPGDKAGLKSGDKIVGVDGEDITDWDLSKAVDVMRGNPGTKVILTIDRDSEILDFEIIRAIIEIDALEYKVLDNNIGYIKIIQFSADSYIETKDALLDLKSQNIESLIIDLRNNPGGYLDEVVYIADLFIDKDKDIVHVDYENQDDITYVAEIIDLFEKDIVVLVNEGSASASEILTGALQDNNEATIVGTTTYGKGTVQTLIKLATGGGMKLTVAEYMTANHTHINKVGIEPDIIIENNQNKNIKKIKESFVPTNELNTIYFKDVSLNVYGVQQRLNALDYNLTLDGMFGPKTLKALNEFQRLNNKTTTNYINKEVINSINDKIDNYYNEDNDNQLKKAIDLLTIN